MDYLIKKADAQKTQENGISRFYEYPFPVKNASLGISEINGRYPESGYDMDEKIEANWYVESGSGTIWVGGESHDVAPGDMLHIPSGEKFWILGNNLRLVVCSSPPWTPEQHKHIED